MWIKPPDEVMARLNGRDPERIEPVMAALKSVWLKHPDLRFTQLISSIVATDSDGSCDDFYMEDSTLLEKIKQFDEEYNGNNT